MVETLMVLIMKIFFAHCLGDYVFQTEYLAKNKGSSLWILFVHSVLYTGAIWVVFQNSIEPVWYLLLFISHMQLDNLKASDITPALFGSNFALAIDQIMHIGLLALVVFVG